MVAQKIHLVPGKGALVEVDKEAIVTEDGEEAAEVVQVGGHGRAGDQQQQ